MALVQLSIAREIVLVAFIVAFVVLGMIAVIMTFFFARDAGEKPGRPGKEDENSH